MTTPSTPEGNSNGQPRDASFWAERVTTLKVGEVPQGAVNLNVEGRRVVNPLLGFGPLWQKTYQVRLRGARIAPAEVVSVWKRRFPEFQPPENRLYPALAGVEPGQIVLLNASMRGLPVDSGLMVLYADTESFAFMTPEGCPEAGWIMCSAFDDEGETVVQVQTQARSNDPLFECGFRFLGGAKQQEKIWTYVLRRVAAHFDVDGEVALNKVCLDPSIRWAGATNVWRNSTVRSVLYIMATPARWVRGGGGSSG